MERQSSYDTNEMIEFLTLRDAAVCISPKSNRKVQQEYEQHLYKERNLVERFFCRIKQFRRLATRYGIQPLPDRAYGCGYPKG